MAWIIASAPFWIVGTVLLTAGVGCLAYGIGNSAAIGQREWNKGIAGSVVLILMSAPLLCIAAWLVH